MSPERMRPYAPLVLHLQTIHRSAHFAPQKRRAIEDCPIKDSRFKLACTKFGGRLEARPIKGCVARKPDANKVSFVVEHRIREVRSHEGRTKEACTTEELGTFEVPCSHGAANKVPLEQQLLIGSGQLVSTDSDSSPKRHHRH